MMIIRSALKKNLIDVYFTMGMEICNGCGFWAGNTALLKDTNAPDPDGASMVIIEALWKELLQSIKRQAVKTDTAIQG